MKVVWICGLPDAVRTGGYSSCLSRIQTPAWSWVLGHLPPPESVNLHIVCPVVGLEPKYLSFSYCGATWHCFKRKRFTHVIAYLSHHIAVRRFINGLKPDIIHGWGGETGFGYLATRLGRDAIVSVQGNLRYYCVLSADFAHMMNNVYGKYMLWRENRTYARAKVLLTESEVSRTALLTYHGHDSMVLPHPLREIFYRNVSREHLLNRDPVFLFIGTLEDRKGAVDAVRAFSTLPYGAKLLIVGSGPREYDMRAIVAKHGISSAVEFKGKCSPREIYECMKCAHYYLLPSYGDTGPTSLKEAMACGLFPICYDNSGPHEYITRYNCGYLAETGDVEKLALLMSKAIENKAATLSAGMAASVRIKSDLSKETVWNGLLRIYKGLNAT